MAWTRTITVMDYELRFTSDCHLAYASDDLEDLKRRGRGGDYRTHIVDTRTGEMIWQSSRSDRFGTKNIDMESTDASLS